MKLLKARLRCPRCPSSDAYHLYSDGHGYCFSCGYYSPPISDKHVEEDVNETRNVNETRREVATEHVVVRLNYQYINYWGMNKGTFEALGVKAACDDEGNPQHFDFVYPNGRVLHRAADEHKFWFSGEKVEDGALLFMDKFAAGSAKAVTITEGARDALAVYELLGGYPVASVTSASSAKNECSEKRSYDWLNSFEKIYICFDNDKPGKDAAIAVSKLFDFNKVYVVNLTRKDAHSYIEPRNKALLTDEWWAAQRFLPEGIVSSYQKFDKIIDDDEFKPSVPYPFPSLEDKTYGIRTGEFVLFTAKEGIGKTELFRSLEYHLLKSTEDNIGIIHLEENKSRSIKGLVGYEVKAPIHLPDRRISNNEIKSTFRSLTRRDDRVHLYSHFGSDDPDTLLSTVRFMAGSCGCRYIFLDHITMAVTGLLGEDERKALDYISTRLAMMVEELDFTAFVISHVNDDGLTRGSRNISKVCDLRIDLHRDITNENDYERNITQLVVSKNRFAGKTGPAGRLLFNPDTFILSEEERPPA